ncbi:hypothetical protein CC86DRAFT_378635 [Ophiobolus disseminans]|uniref:Uncharacterized protein n=1 Tax=Ophiobolus disseminans TaxID=1469910 RepID=A0A6A7ACD0_9PLEO|nr:hypothetical protein CC86DRAFT_378635 [Ophiobolus disseminans]
MSDQYQLSGMKKKHQTASAARGHVPQLPIRCTKEAGRICQTRGTARWDGRCTWLLGTLANRTILELQYCNRTRNACFTKVNNSSTATLGWYSTASASGYSARACGTICGWCSKLSSTSARAYAVAQEDWPLVIITAPSGRCTRRALWPLRYLRRRTKERLWGAGLQLRALTLETRARWRHHAHINYAAYPSLQTSDDAVACAKSSPCDCGQEVKNFLSSISRGICTRDTANCKAESHSFGPAASGAGIPLQMRCMPMAAPWVAFGPLVRCWNMPPPVHSRGIGGDSRAFQARSRAKSSRRNVTSCTHVVPGRRFETTLACSIQLATSGPAPHVGSSYLPCHAYFLDHSTLAAAV